MNTPYERMYTSETVFQTELNIEKDKTKIIKEKEKLYKVNFLHKLLIAILIYIILIEFNKDLNIRPIKVAFYYKSIRYGGIERVLALLLNLLSEEKIFNFYLITEQGISDDEYSIPKNTKRICLTDNQISLFKTIQREHIDIFIYNNYEEEMINELNKIKHTKIIFYNHSSYFVWIYLGHYNFNNSVYNSYKNYKYIISLIPFENDYLFKIWGINSFFMDNPSTFEYDSVIPSELSHNNIIMIGRSDSIKRYDIGVKAMKNIIEEISDSKMYLISSPSEDIEKLIQSLNLEKNVKFTGFQKNIEIYLKNASLHILPSISESYSMVLAEAKIFGIPTILCGLDFLALSKGGTINIYDDNPDTVASEAIKILKNETYRKKLGVEARKSMEKRKNYLIAKRWAKLLYLVFKEDDKTYQELRGNKMSEKEGEQILKNQLKLIQMRRPRFKNLTLEQLKNYSLI